MAVQALLLLALLLQPLLCSCIQQQDSSRQQYGETTNVLTDTVTVASTQAVGQPFSHGSSRTVVDCSQLQGKPAYVVRQGSLVLQNVILQGCRQQAVVLIGPGAYLTARNVTFRGHGSSKSNSHRTPVSNSSRGSSSEARGVVISAQQATVTLDNVVITGNRGALPHGTPILGPSCDDSNSSSGSSGAVASNSTFIRNGSVCGAPVLTSSLIDLQDSIFMATITSFVNNTAGAVISTTGSAQHSLQLLQDTQLQDNTATWLIVADSFAADLVGRENLLAPHPTEQNTKKKLKYEPAYTTHDFIWHLKDMSDWQQELPRQVTAPKASRYVGTAPLGQSPLQLRMHNTTFQRNRVSAGLMWLRLVNTTMDRVSITHNTAMAAGTAGAKLPFGGSRLQPPHLCDMGALERAFLQVVGPAAFDMFRCNVSNNVNPSGAVMRISDGVGFASIRSSILNNNTATAVVRVDGRSWVHDAEKFMKATQATDSDFYRQAEGTTEESYKNIWLPTLRGEQANYDQSLTSTACFVTDARFEHNRVFHAVMLAKGERVDWHAFESRKAQAKVQALEKRKNGTAGPDPDAAAKNVALETFNVMNWWSNVTISNNTFIPATTQEASEGVLEDAISYVSALAFILSGSRADRAKWADRTKCMTAVEFGSLEQNTNVKAYNIKPAVVAATFGATFVAGSFASNIGFQHVVSVHSSTVIAALQLRSNVVESSVLRVMAATARVYNTSLLNNQIGGGSVVQGDSFVGDFQQVTVTDNMAAPVQTLLRAANITSPDPLPMVGDAAGSWPIMALQRIDLGVLRNVTISNNTAPFWKLAIEAHQWNFMEDVQNLTIHNNSAGGIRLQTLQTYYDRQGWVMRDSRITDNLLGQGSGALHLEGFSTRVGREMPIMLDNCVIANNAPAPGQPPPARGGGLTIAPPREDKADSDRGFLEVINITLLNTRIEGNRAIEGGGVWSAWPMLVVNATVRNNTAEKAGGGLYLRGLQLDKLGQGNVVVKSSVFTNNTAQFGGAVACDSCRAFFYSTNITNNTAVREPLPDAAAVSDNSAVCNSSSSSKSGRDDTCTAAERHLQQSVAASVDGAVQGAGGAFAAILKGRSFLRVCGERGLNATPAALTDNFAKVAGGLVYMHYQGPTTCSSSYSNISCGSAAQSGCADHDAAKALSLTRAREGLCGIQLHNIDWSGTKSELTGHLLAWFGGSSQQPVAPFSMHCGDSNNSSSNSSGTVSCGCGGDFGKNSISPLSSQASIIDTSCLQARARSSDSELQRCLLAEAGKAPAAAGDGVGTSAARPPYLAFAGDAVNLTIGIAGIGPNIIKRAVNASQQAASKQRAWPPCGDMEVSAELVNTSRKANDTLAVMELKQDHTGKLFVIGKPTAIVDDLGFAHFCNMALQPIDQPLHNRNYTFSFEPDRTSGFYAQVPNLQVTVQLLRCTLGQHMTINRCVRCAESGTFSLHPNRSCQPCVPGGLCHKGLLQPQPGYWSYNPFVPQIIPCPLKGACVDRNLTLQQLAALVPWLKGAPAWDAGGAGAVTLQQQQQQQEPTVPGEKPGLRHRQLLHAPQFIPVGGDSSIGPGEHLVNRTAALQRYNSWLADAITYDPEEGPYRLYNVTYRQLLDSWWQVQCNKGYKGYMCSSCETAYVDPPDPNSSSSSRQRPRRFAFHRDQCVDCSTSTRATWVALVLLFALFLGYVGVGIFCQINSVADKISLQGNPSSSSSGAAANPFWRQCCDSDVATASERSNAPPAAGGVQTNAQSGPERGQPGVESSGADAAVCIDSLGRDQAIREEAVPAAAAAAAAGDGAGANADGPTECAAGLATEGSHGDGGGSSSGGGTRGASGQHRSATPVQTLVAMWKVLTTYVQILAMVRFLPSLTGTAEPLAFADLSSFSKFAAFDCVLPGPPNKLAYTRILLTAFGVPVLGFVAFLLAWVVRWGLHQWGALLHQRASSCTPAGAPSTLSLPSRAVGNDASISMSDVAASASQQTPKARSATVLPLHRSDTQYSQASEAAASVTAGSTVSNRSKGSVQWLHFATTSAATVSSAVQSVPSAALSRLQRFGAKRPPVSLRQYLSVRLTITAVVLGYSCYSLFTSSMLQTLACHPIREVADTGQSAAAEYGARDMIREFGALHHNWLQERSAGLMSESGVRNAADDSPGLCHPAQQAAGAAGGGGSMICQVSGQFWKQDYSVQCFKGDHAILAGFGGALLVLVGILLPLLFGLLLWHKKHKLNDEVFSAKYSFMYHEYREQVCYWEFVIMARKLAFLGIFVALNAPLASPESVTLLQLYIAAALAVGALLLNVFLQPFENEHLNHLECAGLTAVTLTFLLLGASVTLSSSPAGRWALLVLTGIGNLGLICYFVWHMCALVWRVYRGVAVEYLRKVRVSVSRFWHGQGRCQAGGCLQRQQQHQQPDSIP